ncbi:MAG TPA: LysE family transporter [Planctomycetota bacterium]|nr:LysE family transporter [Planctomycetota bacterium]
MPDAAHWIEGWFRVEGPAGLLCLAAGSFVAALSGALSPGPLLVAAIREGARQGARAGAVLTLGHGILEAAVVALIYAGLGERLARPGPKAVLALAGGTMLLVMAVAMLVGARRASVAELSASPGPGAPGGRGALGRTVLAGALVSMSNPYWWIWWVTVGMGYMASASIWGWAGVWVFFAGHILADLGWYWLVTWAVSRGRRLLTDRSYRLLIAGCALVLVAFAASFLGMGAGMLSDAAGGGG